SQLLAGGRGLFQCTGVVGAEPDVGAGAGEHLRRQRPERAGAAGDDRGLAADVEQRERIFQEVFGHDTLAATTVSPPSLPALSRQSIIFARRWMRGSSPRMTEHAGWPLTSLLRPRYRDPPGHDRFAPIDDLAALVRPDEAGVVGLEHGLLAAGDEGEFAREHVVDLLRGRCVGAGAAAGQEMREADGELLRPAGVEAE